MIKKLRHKFVRTAMTALLLILISLIAVINLFFIAQNTAHIDEMLGILSENNGQFPKPDRNPDNVENHAFGFRNSIEAPYEIRFFWVRFDSDNQPLEINTGHIASITSSEASEYADKISSSDKTKGYIDTYRYLVSDKDDGSRLILFADCSSSFNNAIFLFATSIIVGIVSLIAMFILVCLLSGNAVAPVVESLEKQKRFITDAGHELKTPLAVISANTDVIELENGSSKWIENTRTQIKRMSGLISDMLTLSRMDEEKMHIVFSDIDLSSIVASCATAFDAIAESKDKAYHISIDPDIHIKGDKESITQLCSILIDNAMKYSTDNGNISVSLKQRRSVFLTVSNDCSDANDINTDKLFDRFYRVDSSRSRKTGGYGIGLSVAMSIANSHGGNIRAVTDKNSILFTVTLPRSLSPKTTS